MELMDLEIFIVVSEERSMNKASHRMYMAQSAVSTRMQNLERRIGFPLFVRSRSGVQLTPAGVRFLKYAIGSINAIRQGEKSLSNTPVGKSFCIGATRSLAVKYVSEILSICQSEDPAKILETTTASSDEILALTRSGALDLGLIYDSRPPEGVHSFPLKLEDIVLISHEPLKSFNEFITSLPLIQLQNRGTIEQDLKMLMDMMNIEAQRIIARVDTMEVLIELVRKGVGNAIIPRSYLQSEHFEVEEVGCVAHKNIYVKKAPSFLPGRTVYVVWNERKLTKLAEQVVNRLAVNVGSFCV